jgi:transcriptional regulator with XRE-family HTH domain
MLNITSGNQLKAARALAGLTQRELAIEAGFEERRRTDRLGGVSASAKTGPIRNQQEPVIMARGPERLEAFAQALATGVTPVQAAKIAGYPNGSCFAANARKRARRNDVKAMVAELQKPMKEKLQQQIEANFEWATQRLIEIANTPIGIWNVKSADSITNAIKQLAAMYGWNAPEKSENKVVVERVERVIVDHRRPPEN